MIASGLRGAWYSLTTKTAAGHNCCAGTAALLAPALWLAIAGTILLTQDVHRVPGYPMDYVTDYLLEYWINPALIYWFASLPVAVAAWLVWRRASFGMLPLLLLWAVHCFAVVFVLALYSITSFDRSGCLMFCSDPPHAMDGLALWDGLAFAVWSLPPARGQSVGCASLPAWSRRTDCAGHFPYSDEPRDFQRTWGGLPDPAPDWLLRRLGRGSTGFR